jgi:hypothetical protein
MSYQFLGEDEETFKVKHPDGSEFSIAKSAVGPEVHKRIKSLKPIKMADGGFVPEFENEFPGSEKKSDKEAIEEASIPSNPMKEYGRLINHYKDLGVGGLGGSPETRAESDYNALIALRNSRPESLSVSESARLKSLEGITSDALPQPADASIPQEMRVPAQAAPAVPAVQSLEQPILQSAPAPQVSAPALSQPAAPDPYNQAILATNNMMAVQQRETEIQNKLFDRYAEQQAAADAALAAEIEPYKKDNLILEKALKDNPIDSGRLWKNTSTGNKIIAAIGIALSGMGSGLTGQKNLALDVIDKNIDRDIAEQKAELGKKETLYSMNLKKIGNAQAAWAATKSQLLSNVKVQTEKSMNLTKNAEALQRGALLVGELGQKQQKLNQEAGANTLKQKLYSGQIPITDENFNLLPENDRERFVKIGNRYLPAKDSNSAKEATKVIIANDTLVSLTDQLIALRKKYGSETIPGPVKSQMVSLGTAISGAVKNAESLGTLDNGVKEFTKDLIGNPVGFGFVESKLQTLKESQMRKFKSSLNAYGVNTSSLPQQSQETKTVGGIKYIRGPNGEAIAVK